ncbi:MAG: ATP-binding protein [Saprospiraceae bacterium]
MKKTYCIAIAWLLATTVLAQQNALLDSLERELALPHPDSVQVSMLNKLAAQYMRFNMAMAQEKMARSAALTEKFSSRWADEGSFLRHRAHTQLTMGNMLYRQGKYAECLNFYFESLRIYEQMNDPLGQGKALTGIGGAYYYFKDLEKALLYYRQAESNFEKLKFLNGLLAVKANIANILDDLKKHEEASTENRSVGEIAEKYELWEVAAGAWQNAMNHPLSTGNLDQASAYADRARKALEKTNDRSSLAMLFARLSSLYYQKNDFGQVRILSQQTLDIGKQLDNQLIIRTGYTNLASGFLGEAKITDDAVLKDSFYVKSVELVMLERAYADTIFSTEKSRAVAELQVKYETEKKEREISQLSAAAKNREIEALQRQIELRQEKINAERAREQAFLMEKTNQNINLDLEVKEARLQEQNALAEQSRIDIELLRLKNEQQVADARNERQLRYGLLLGLLALAVFSFLLYRNIRHRILAQRKIEQQRAEIAAQNASLEAANNYKSIFLSNMSHEIRTPLNSIIGMSDLLHDTELSPRQREFASVVRHASENLLAIINEILDFSKIEAGKMDLRPQPFDLHELLHRQVQMLKLQAEQKQIGLQVRLDPELPRHVIADPTRLNQILLNLLSNAVKFTEKGSVTLAATVQESLPDESLCLLFSVCDTGIGIPPEQLEMVFEPFVQAGDDTHLRHSGTGLGLAIARQLVELQGGKINASSVPGEGSEFAFTLLVQLAESMPAIALAQPASRLARLDILLVEDNQFNQMLATELLQKLIEEPQIRIAGNGQEAIEAAASARFDLILMDVKMPVIDGFAATKAIRAMQNTTPIIALTANATSEEREKCLAHGMDDYVSKPISMLLLEEKIRAWAYRRSGT